MPDYYVPRFRYELIEWFERHYPDWSTAGWSKKKLLAIYFKIRNNENQHNN